MQTSTRDQRIIDSIPLVGYLARTVSGAASSAHREALTRAGALALIDAADSFESSPEESFTPYAQQRILEAFAALEGAAEQGSTESRMPVRATSAAETLSTALGRSLTSAELAMVLGVAAASLRERTDDTGRVTVSVEDDAVQQLVSSGIMSPEAAAEQVAAVGRIRDALDDLPERLARVVRGLYFEGRTAASLAEEWGVEVAEVLRDRAQALRFLQDTVTTCADADTVAPREDEAAHTAPAKEAHYSQIAQRGRDFAQSLFPQRSPA